MLRYIISFYLCSLLCLSAFPVEPVLLGDYAGLLSQAEQQELRGKLREHQSRTGIEVKVVTIASFSAYPGSPTQVEPFATRLFNIWGIGDSSKNDGVLFLVSQKDRKMRIEVGSGYGTALNHYMESVISETVIPEFKKGQFGKGIISGTEQLFMVLKNYREELRSPIAQTASRSAALSDSPVAGEVISTEHPFLPAPSPTQSSANREGGFLSTGGVLGLLGGIGAVILGVVNLLPKKCPSCKTKLFLLSEAVEDAHLNAQQRFEESIGSIEYDVWDCSSCEHVQVHRRSKLFSGYKQCPSCKTKALQSKTETITRATTMRQGLKRIQSSCRYCAHEFSVDRVIPRVDDSSSGFSGGGSSSSGGFSSGGGSSSGGGASGSW